MKNKFIIGLILISILGITTFFYYVNDKKTFPPSVEQVKNSESEIISQNGLHWHSVLTIYVKGEKLSIPPNIGLSVVHKPVHTHDEDVASGIIHLEFVGQVRKSDTVLGEFFKSWNRDIRSFGANMKMTVNGVENILFENYEMKDGDKIELRYE